MRKVLPGQVVECAARVIDVRDPDEFLSERLGRAELVPLDRLPAVASAWDRAQCLVTLCKSGARSAEAAEILESMGFKDVLVIEGGLDACKKAGIEVIRDRRRIPVFRQVMIVAGCLLLAGLVLAAKVHPGFIVVDWFVAVGLVFGGVTGYCPMVKILQKMPWNAAKRCDARACGQEG